MIIDTDMDTDDVLGISYLLQQMNRGVVKVEAIVVTATGFSDQWAGVEGAMRLTKRFGHPDIPVAHAPRAIGYTVGGSGAPAAWRSGIDDFLQDTNIRPQYLPLPYNPRPAYHRAAELYRSTLERNGPRGTSILAMGPWDAIRDARALDEQMAANTRTLYVSGGAFDPYLNATHALLAIANETTRKSPHFKAAMAEASRASSPLVAQDIVVEYARKNLPKEGWPPADGGKTPGSAWNIFSDPLSAQGALQFGGFEDVVMMTDNATHQLFVYEDDDK